MCTGRKDKKAPPAPVIRKKKPTLCNRCCRACRRCWWKICKKCCSRCCKRCTKNIIGLPEVPRAADYEVAGVDLADIKQKFKLKDSATVLTLFQKALKIKNSKWNQSLKNIDLIEDYGVEELKRKFSVKGSKEVILKNMVNDYKRGRLSLSNIQASKYDVRNLNKEQLNTLINDYSNAQKEKYANLNSDDLKKKFVVKKSKEKVLERMVEDYKKGKLSATALSNKKGFDPKKLNQNKLDKMLQEYTDAQGVHDIKRKFSIKGSKEKLFDNFVEDYKKGKTDGLDPKKLNKNDIDNILKKYQTDQEGGTKVKKSVKNLMENFKSLKNLQSLINQAKARYL